MFTNILSLHTYTDLFITKGSLKASTGFIPSFWWTKCEHQCLLFFFISCHRAEVYRHSTSLCLLAQLHWLQGPAHGRGSWPHVCGQQRLHPLPGPKWHQQRAPYSKQEYTLILSQILSLGAVMRFLSKKDTNTFHIQVPIVFHWWIYNQYDTYCFCINVWINLTADA